MSELMNQLTNHGGDCRTAPATPGLLTNIGCLETTGKLK